MKGEYDLSTVAGLRTAVADARRNPIAKIMFGNSLWLADKGLGILEKVVTSVSPGAAVEKQAKAATDLIAAGKENGVKKMKITMDEQAGAHLNIPVEGVKVSASIGSKGKTTIEVEYA